MAASTHREGAYSKLMEEHSPRHQFVHDEERRGAPIRGSSRMWPPAGPFRLATLFLTVLCLVLLVCLVVVASHREGVSVSEGQMGRQEQEVNVTSLEAALRRLQQKNTELLAKLAANTEATQFPRTRRSAVPPAGSSSPAPPVGSSSPATPAVSSSPAPPAGSSSPAPPVGSSSPATPAVSSSPAPPAGSSSPAPPVGSSSPVPPAGSSSPTPRVVCPEGWLSFQGSCYFVSQASNDWESSQGYCEQKGGHLAIITSPEEQAFLWDQLPRGHWSAYWIGLSDAHTEDSWKWVDGTPLAGGFWEEGEPNNHIDEDCGYMVKTRKLERVSGRSWYDAPCSMFRPFICER